VGSSAARPTITTASARTRIGMRPRSCPSARTAIPRSWGCL